MYRLHSPRMPSQARRARASAPWHGHRENGMAVTKFGFMRVLLIAENAARAKAAHDTRVILFAQLFFNNKIAIPTNGRMP